MRPCTYMRNPREEAKYLLPLVESGHETYERLHALIDVTPREERSLYKLEGKLIAERAIEHRKLILIEFDRLIARQIEAGVRR
jgi:hypothetical protein